ncbi:MAG: hypothetical protein ABSD38_28925 [Syntrophorhabdales bacterium]|jgi:hypothetical protein
MTSIDNFAVPPTFPETQFREFAQFAGKFFGSPLSDENWADPFRKQMHFSLSLEAILYRYRACCDCNDEFKRMLRGASDLWRQWGSDREQIYQMERCLYMFFMNASSVFESVGFCLYFLAHVIQPEQFPLVKNPKDIRWRTTRATFKAAFPDIPITKLLSELSQDAGFIEIGKIRNILAHRVAGRRSIRSWSSRRPDGTYSDVREEKWYLPGSDEQTFDKELIQRHLNKVTELLTKLLSASIELAQASKPA